MAHGMAVISPGAAFVGAIGACDDQCSFRDPKLLVLIPRDFTDLTQGGAAKSGWLTMRHTRTSSRRRRTPM